ncbi:SDR family NAD(P)-dependent oxidoreductase [Natrialbaceae archaeon A-CW1-1]
MPTQESGSSDQRHPKTALITGGSRGIGRALAAEFAADGWELVLVARDEERLEAAARNLHDEYDVAVTAISIDLVESDAPERIRDHLLEREIRIDALVNNAATATYGPYAESDLETERNLLRVNVEAPLALITQFLPPMRERDDGLILTVASTAAFQPGPYMAGYHASKVALVSATESIAEECRDSGVTVTTLCPGPVSTGIHDRSGRGSSWLERRFMLTPERVAAAGYRGAKRGDGMVIPGRRNRILATFARLLPHRLRRRFGRWVVVPGVIPWRKQE